MLRTGWKDALAYRSELVVWMLTMTLPLIMLALFRAVAAEGAIGGFDAPAFTAYFLATLTVRQLASSWVVWEMNREVREGALGMRLLRPIHPLWGYLCDSIAAIPLRALISVPFSLGLLYAIEGPAGATLARDPLSIALFLLSLLLAFLLGFAFSALIGALALYFESALGIWHVYIGLYALLSGYLVPLALFPPWLRHLAAATPFPYLQALPVELLLGRHPLARALRDLAAQVAWAAGVWAVLLLVWRDAQKRFAAYGG
jgi:ABC-2 type transport system permease protein